MLPYTVSFDLSPGLKGMSRGHEAEEEPLEHPGCCVCLPQVLYQDCRMVAVSAPYVAGFLAFREVPVLVEAVQRLQQEEPQLQPQVWCVSLVPSWGVLAAESWERKVFSPRSLSWWGRRGTVKAVVEPPFLFLREQGCGAGSSQVSHGCGSPVVCAGHCQSHTAAAALGSAQAGRALQRELRNQERFLLPPEHPWLLLRVLSVLRK